MKLFLFLVCVLIAVNSKAQVFKKDLRPNSVKEDALNSYQANEISKGDLLSALDDLGIRIFNCQLLPHFTKYYKLNIDLDEYLNGRIVNTKNISPNEDNVYFFWEQNKQYSDYIRKIKFISRETDSVSILSVNIMGNITGGIKLKKELERKHQYYSWRRFSKTNWSLNTKVPMLIYASSWYDKKFNIERFCGVVDLSKDKIATMELLNNSSHYFLISYKISN